MVLAPRLKNTYSLLYHLVLFFILASFLLRLVFMFLSLGKADIGFFSFLRVIGTGLLFDMGVAVFISLPYALYLLLFPIKWVNSKFNRIVTHTAFLLLVFLLVFSFFAEFTFWQEFESRFNFIAVDYLIYTYEVINNINESYPLPLLIGIMAVSSLLIFLVFKRRKYFEETFHGTATFKERLILTTVIIGLSFIYGFTINNRLAETGSNRYQNEIAKAGIYSFVSAYKNNELSYELFYKLIDTKEAFGIMKQELGDSSSTFTGNDLSIKRKISNEGTMLKPNVIMVTIESLSADFMAHFGNKARLTPVLDSIANKGLLFTNLYATGTRTVRGMEALSLSIPPTPGNSIVRRENNQDLNTVGHIFQQAGYKTGFFYGGDGYFDNMNGYFGNNGYTVTDRGRSRLVNDDLKAGRNIIPDSAVHFENAWGICDEDLYDAVIRDADISYKKGQLFYDFVMTTSNHKPYTYPGGKIDIPSGSGREGAVKYTDYAIGEFLRKAINKPWFQNTVFIFIADHCANSAGKNEIDITKYHIPAMVFNLPGSSAVTVDKLCSQIDLYPTLLHLLNWDYDSNLYGKDVLSTAYTARIVLGTYQKLAYIKNDTLVILSPQQKAETFKYTWQTNEQMPVPENSRLIKEAISNYQTAYYLFKNGGLKQ